MYKAYIVDDEQYVIQDLKGLLEMNCPEVEVIGTSNTSQEALLGIKSLQPHLIFMDINIDEVSGLDLVRQLDLGNARVIFVTAHDQYAIEAFKLSAVDYLLKPVDADELIEAVHRATADIEKDQIHSQLTALAHNLMPGSQKKKIVLSDMEGLHIIDIPDILWCHANGSYTEFHMQNGETLTVSKHLKTYESMLVDHGLMRVHRSYIVNIYNISKIERSKGEIRMKNDETLPISIAPDLLKSILGKLQS
ncbi:LytR/AlgR family response regulator transcription factor [Ekhidna sp.]|uniref:LytR/AlgR family response regulator transcription factor n=1 Tax=Ekhidna sp. TaxID=2608089 RepID=UPI0035154530